MKKQVKYLLLVGKIKSLKYFEIDNDNFINTLSIWTATFLLPTTTRFFMIHVTLSRFMLRFDSLLFNSCEDKDYLY